MMAKARAKTAGISTDSGYDGDTLQEDMGVSLRWSCRKICRSRRRGTE